MELELKKEREVRILFVFHVGAGLRRLSCAVRLWRAKEPGINSR